MVEKADTVEKTPLEEFIDSITDELEQVRTELKEIGLLVEQSQGEVDKLAQRNASITAHLHQMQAHFETVPRDDIKTTYEAFQDAQQRLFTMRGQLEKLQSDEAHLQRLEGFLSRAVQLLVGQSEIDTMGDLGDSGDSLIQQIITAQEEERRKISRQIHDGPAQALSNFILQTEIAQRLFKSEPEKASDELNNLKTAAASAFANVRDFIFDLRPMMLDDLGLVPTIRRYIEAYKEKTGLDLSLGFTGTERRVEAHKEVLAFRAVQNLLRYIRDNAQATQVKVLLDLGEAELRIAVEDNGRGVDILNLPEDEAMKYGLHSLQDRVERVGGEFDAESAAGEGTHISFTIPISD